MRNLGGSQIALGECERGKPSHSDQFGAGDPRSTVMFACLYAPRDACLQQGGEGGVNITAQRLGHVVMCTPSPRGAGTARPADLFGQLQSR